MASYALSDPARGAQRSGLCAGIGQVSCKFLRLNGQSSRRPGRNAGRGRHVVLAARVATSSGDTDLRALLNDALQRSTAPSTPSEAVQPPPAASALPPPVQAAVEAPAQAPARSQALEEAIRNTSSLDNGGTGSGPSAAAPPAQQAAADSAAASAEQLSPAAPEQLSPAAPVSPDPVQGADLGAYLSQGADSAAAPAAAAPSAAADAVGGATDGAAEAGRGAADTLSSSLGSAQEAAGSVTEGPGAQAKAALDAASEAASGLGASASEAAAGLQQAASGALDSLNQATSGAMDTAMSSLKGVTDSAGAAAASLQDNISAGTSAAGAAVEAASASLPEPVRSGLSALVPPITQAASQVAQSPPLLAATVGAAVGLPAVSYWRARYGGYAGQLRPEQAVQLLEDEDAVLVDIRSEQERERAGVVDLRFGALGKGAAVPVPAVVGSLARSVRSASELSFQIAAALVAGLGQPQVSPRTRVLVLDGRGSPRAVQLARTLRALGLSRSYVVQGGFKRWAAEGWGVRQDVSDYATTPVALIGEKVNVLASTTGAALGNPGVVGATVAAAGVAYFALSDTLVALRWVGTLGLLLTVTSRALSYDSPQEALDDVQGIFGSVGSAGSRLKGLLPTGALASLSGNLRSTAGSTGAAAPQYSAPSTAEREDEGGPGEIDESGSEPKAEEPDTQRGTDAASTEARSRSDFAAKNA